MLDPDISDELGGEIVMNPYIGDRDLDSPESDFECPGCGMYFNGFGTLSHHTARCHKALMLEGDDPGELDDYPDASE